MSLGKNILANYVSQIYVTLIGIIMVPLYIRYMGAETYGLVGFFAILQAWFNLLDMGLTPTVARETARFQGGALAAVDYRRLVRALEGVFLTVGLAGGAGLLIGAHYIASEWLQAATLPVSEIVRAVQIMSAVIVLRWISGLYRGVISGAQHLVWLSAFNSVVSTIRFAGVIPLLKYVDASPTLFFGFQLLVSSGEFVVLFFYAYQQLPRAPSQHHSCWNWAPVKPVLKLSLGLAFASSVSVLVSYMDKLLLSRLLPLADYGHFTLAVLVASGIVLLSAPVSGAIMPRLARLEAQGDHQSMLRIYRQATQLVAVIAGSAAVTLAFCSDTLLLAWTGDGEIARKAAPMLTLYALGNGIQAVASFPYYLQYAKGDLRLHLIGNAMFVILMAPLIVWAVDHYGVRGAGYTWLGMNLLALFAWLPLVHRKYQPGLNLKWYLQDIFVIYLGAGVAAYWIHPLAHAASSRWGQLLAVVAIGVMVAFAAGLCSSVVRQRALHFLRRPRDAA